jgi:uncharacterized protein YbcI
MAIGRGSEGQLPSKPTWQETLGFPATSAFFMGMQAVFINRRRGEVDKSDSILAEPTIRTGLIRPTIAERLAHAASAFEQRLTGHAPKSVTVVMSGETLVITMHGALSPAERVMAQSPSGAAKVQELHRQMFLNSADALRLEIKEITGVDVRELAAEIEPTTGTVVKAFTSGTVVQVFLLAENVPTETWSGSA